MYRRAPKGGLVPCYLGRGLESMFGIQDLWLFVISGLLLNMTPGADLLYLIDRSIAQGVRFGIAAGIGASLGCIVHIFLAVVGLSAILHTSDLAFTIVQYLGAAYLIYLGLSTWEKTHKVSSKTAISSPNSGLYRVATKAIMINLFNPKVALFFIAFFPQFIDIDNANSTLAFVFLGAIFVINATLWNVFVAWSASGISNKLALYSKLGILLQRLCSIIFIGLGLRLGLSEVG